MDNAAQRPSLYLVKNDSCARPAPRPVNKGSAIVLEAENGELKLNVVRILTSADAAAIVTALAMALVQALHAQSNL
jgi:hypothetical protein